MSVTGDDVAVALAEMREELSPFLTGGRSWRKDGAFAVVTGLPVPILNAVWLERANPSVAAVAALLDEVSATGLPYCLQLRPGSDESLAALAASRDMTGPGEVPLMAVEDAGPAISPPPGLSIRQLTPDQAPLHAQVAAAGFGIEADVFLHMVSPGLLELDTVRCYLGEADGQLATTAISMTCGTSAGIFNVATVPGFRGRGFGAAVSARAVADALALGATSCWLQSSPQGYPLYRKLGFRTIETWPYWISRTLLRA